MDKKVKYLFRNTGLLLVGNFSSKILVFLLVPFYTSILTTAEYGSYDLLYTTVQLLFPILSMNIIDGVMRYTIGEDLQHQREACTVGLKYVGLSCLSLSAITFFLAKVLHAEILVRYFPEFILLYICYAFHQFTIQFIQGIGDISGLSVAGVIGTAVMIGGNLLFLLVFRAGFRGYILAYIASFFVPSIFLFFRSKMYRYISRKVTLFEMTDREKEMLKYSIPLVVTTISWYVNSASDRYAVTYFCGIAVNGIYSVSYKIPAILNAFQSTFIKAWQLSAIREFGEENGEDFYQKVYEGCETVMLLLCSMLILSTKILARILFSDEFYSAWIYVPTLLLYSVFNTLSGAIGGVLSAAKDTGAFAKSALIGVSINILLNIIMVYLWGAGGAAVATVISSIVIWAMRMHYSRKYVCLTHSLLKHSIEYCLIILQVLLMTIFTSPWAYAAQIVILLTLLSINFSSISSSINRRKKK